MFSVTAREKLSRRGWSATSLLLFFRDSWDDSCAQARARPDLVLAVALTGALSALGIVVAAAPLYLPERAGDFARFGAVTALGAVVFSAWASLAVGLVREGGVPAPRLGLPNVLTLLRLYLIAPALALFAQGHTVAFLAAYGLIGASDVADGVIARKWGPRTDFGVVVDPLADVFATAGIFVLFAARELIPGWLLAILMVRYTMLIVGSFFFFLLIGPLEFRATVPGKVVGVLQAAGALAIGAFVAAGVDWQPRWGPIIYPFLGLCFASIVVSQATIALRERRRLLGARNEVVERGSRR
jgi:cardiolipin synthase